MRERRFGGTIVTGDEVGLTFKVAVNDAQESLVGVVQFARHVGEHGEVKWVCPNR